MPIPYTRVRLKGYASLKTVAGGIFLDPSGDISAQIAAIKPEDLLTVGAVQRVFIDQIREENQFYRQFVMNASAPEQAAKPVETYPGLISFKGEMERVEMHDANLFEAFRMLGRNIVQQYKALILFIDQFTPPVTIQNSPTGDPNKSSAPRRLGETQRIIVPGVWLNRLPMEFSVTDSNQAYIPSVEFVIQDVI